MPNKDHDVLVYSSQGDLYQVPVVQPPPKGAPAPVEGDPAPGSYATIPKPLTMRDSGYRKVDSIARYENSARGAGFAVLPNKPDPQSSQMSCYLINPQNFQTTTPWTATEWSSAEDKQDDGIALDLSRWEADAFEFLVAVPLGKVYFARKLVDEPPTFTLVDLAKEGEIWTQLRNGLVVGTVKYVGHPKGPTIVALFNQTSVTP